MNDSFQTIIDYHLRTKHHLHRYARSLGYMDWATQPDPFRRYDGAQRFQLDFVEPADQPDYDAIFDPAGQPPRPMDRSSISQLFYDSLAISAWKSYGENRWALRCNPSSGNLHPTEGYLIAPPVSGLTEQPGLYHYWAYEHALERRALLDQQLPPNVLYVGLTSIYVRESWKYGERAFRYCHHDVGHAIGAIVIAAALLGWRARMVDRFSDKQLGGLLGVEDQSGHEAERPDCLLMLYPHDMPLPPASLEPCRLDLTGEPNRLSSDHHAWPLIDTVAAAAERGDADEDGFTMAEQSLPGGHGDVPARKIIRRRRSAMEMDGQTVVDRQMFYRMMHAVMPEHCPLTALSWRPGVHLAVFVHRVTDLSPGVYMLMRSDDDARLRAACDDDFAWTRPADCPDDLPLYLLKEGDYRALAKTISCHQDIASDGAFALGMIADFNAPLKQHGPWFYKRLFWETGLIGQVLYLEAEAAGIRATGIGCFFDDAMHDLLGMTDLSFQSLYHFTIGGPVDDPRLQMQSAYVHLQKD